MKIRTRLTLQFVSIVATIVAIAMSLIYYFSSQQRERDFYTRLRNKAFTASKILVQIDAVNKDVMKLIDEKESSILVNKNVTMYDYLNNEIYNYDPDHRVKVDKDLLNKIRLEKEVRFLYKNYQVVGILYVDKFERLVTIASAIDELGYEKLADLKLTLISVFFSSVILVTFAGWFFAGRALAPISGVIREVDKISPANLSARVNEGNSMDEIASLASTFNKMLDRMEFAFRVQRMFVANASHELRTPLTSVMGQLEVSLLKPRTQEEYQKALTSVLEDIKALAGLSNKLLLLTRVSMNYEGTDFDDIRIDDLLWQSREELVKANPAYNITIDFKVGHFDEQLLIVRGNRDMLRTAFANLMENACKYSADMSCRVRISFMDGAVCIEFRDRGIGIEPQEQKNIFEPFYRGRNTSEVKGHGIGLSLVKNIIQVHNGTITLESEPGKGSVFTLNLPQPKLQGPERFVPEFSQY